MNRKIGAHVISRCWAHKLLNPYLFFSSSLILILKLSGTKEVILDMEPRLDRIGQPEFFFFFFGALSFCIFYFIVLYKLIMPKIVNESHGPHIL